MESIFQEDNYIILMAIGILFMVAFSLAFVLFVNYSQKKILTEQMRIQKLDLQHQEELLHSNILTQEAERKRIARDLHDEIGSKLNVIFLNMHRLKTPGKSSEDIGIITKEVESVINTTINSIRLISHELLPPTLEEFGLAEAIRELQFSFNKLGSIHIDFTQMEDSHTIKSQLVELNLFRVLQELLNNSIKHGQANEIEIKLRVTGQTIALSYKDNGIGFDTSLMEVKRGLGMNNIESRLQMIQADHQYKSALGKGTTVKITLAQEKDQLTT